MPCLSVASLAIQVTFLKGENAQLKIAIERICFGSVADVGNTDGTLFLSLDSNLKAIPGKKGRKRCPETNQCTLSEVYCGEWFC